MIRALPALLFLMTAPALAGEPQLEMCGNRPNTSDKTCLVDGDTLWLYGENIRLKDFDTPEPQTQICGGDQEVALAKAASARMLDLLNSNDWTIKYFGYDRTSSRRRLAAISIDGQDVSNILIGEHLARSWPNGEEWWCR
ncbi:thermonuclease family protein [Devosia aurantiaca]|uniref:Thermonuclease family protein n=1 Tax=Devosia aurantiaca TaxID=2714858 RepID=A0A6M1SV48_9HYPH|nr:thermonuclease family protein [Devosia aurantiaca]NGP19262.1 thermonuclease family protein [Devosia aurantiaca]